jgi:uncharacterized protein (TIGR04222 family)
MLDPCHEILYQRLKDFELDDPHDEFGFTRHLIKNHGWTLSYAERVISEYKRFAFLTVVADHQVVPSDQVDQVWHSHILLTKSYWEEFCPKILQKNLHHHPARGGKAERAEFHSLYAKTIDSYRYFFGQPPTDIWSPPDRRFGEELKMRRINIMKNWVIPKKIPKIFISNNYIFVAIIALATVGYSTASNAASLVIPADSPYPYLYIFIGSIIIGILLRFYAKTTTECHRSSELDIYETAYLAGGRVRSVELAITQLVAQGYLLPNILHRTLTIQKKYSFNGHELEQQVMRYVQRTPDLARLQNPDNYETQIIDLQKNLKRKQIFLTGSKEFVGSSFISFILVTFLGWMFRMVLQILNISIYAGGENLLGVVWMAIGITTACCFIFNGRTNWGNRVYANIYKNQDVYDVIQRFALHGSESLSGGALDDLKQIFKDQAQADAEETGGCGCGC